MFSEMFSKFFKINNPFENQWIFYRFDKFSEKEVSDRQRLLQKIKYQVVCLYHFVYIIIQLNLAIGSCEHPIHCFGFYHLFGGIPKFLHWIAIFGSLLSLSSL